MRSPAPHLLLTSHLPAVEALEGRWLLSTSIKGAAYIDLSGDGRKSRGEKPVEGMHVYLDTNDNQTFDAGEPLALTNRKGKFGFKKLAREVYHVRAELPDGYVTINPPGGAWFADLRFRKSASKQDFALWPTALGAPPVLGKHPNTPDPPLPLVLYNTGATQGNSADGTNTKPLLGGGAGEGADPYWLIERFNPAGGPLPFQPAYYSYNPARYNADFQPNSPQVDSTFIGPTRNGLEAIEPGKFMYATAFDLQGIEPNGVSISGVAVADGHIDDVRLNGLSLGLSANAGQTLPLSILSGFVPGINTLEFVVDNPTPGPTGLRVDALRGLGKKIAAGPITLSSTGVAGANNADGTNASRLGARAIDPHYFVSIPGNGLPFYSDDNGHHYIYNNSFTAGKFGNAFVASDSTIYDNSDLIQTTAGADSAFVNPVGAAAATLPEGTYIYRTYFDLTGLDANSATITGTLLAADSAVDIYINGNATGQGVGASFLPNAGKAFTITGTQGMVSGINVLDFIIRRDPGTKGTAVRVDGLRGTAGGFGPRASYAYPLRLPLPPLPPIQPPAVT